MKAIAKQQDQQNLQNQQNLVELVKVLFPQLQGVSDLEVAKAIALARKLGLDPLRKEVHFVPFGGRVQLVISYIEYIKKAERSGKLDGWITKLGKDEFGMYAEVEIYRKDWKHPFKWRVYLEEVKKETPNWKTMPLFMLRKTAIAQGFKLAFPEENQELPESEMVEYETVEEGETTPETQETISEAQAKRLWAIAKTVGKEAGIGREEVEKAVREVLNGYGFESTKEIPTALYEEIIESVKTRILELAKAKEEEKEG
jgi:phage recombination protein Bet